MASRKKTKTKPAEVKNEASSFDIRNLTEEQKTLFFKYVLTGKIPTHGLKPRVSSIDQAQHPLAISREMFNSMMRIATYFALRGNWRVCRELVGEAFAPLRRIDYSSSPSYGAVIHWADVTDSSLQWDDGTVLEAAQSALTRRGIRARLALYIRALRIQYQNSPEFT